MVKSTLVDALLKQSDTDLGKLGDKELIMDFNELERERGITIFSKMRRCNMVIQKSILLTLPGTRISAAKWSAF